MKAFHQAPVVGHVFPSSQRSCVFFRSRPYLVTRECSRSGPSCYSFSHLHQLVASKDTEKKHGRLMVNSLPEMSSPDAWECKDAPTESPKNIMDAKQEVLTEDMDPRFIESIIFDKYFYKYEILDRKNCVVKIMKQQGLMSAGNGDEILFALDKIEQDILRGKFEWKDSQDVHTNIMEALVNFVGENAKELTTSNKSDRCLFILKTWCMDCVESITTRVKQIQVALVSLAIRNKGLVLTGIENAEDNSTLESIILPIVKALAANDLRSFYRALSCTISFGCALADSYNDRCQIEFIGDRINYGVPEILMHLVNTFISLRNLPSFIPNDEVVMYDTFLEKFRPSGRTDSGFFALRNCLNTVTYRVTDYFDIEEAKFYLFAGVENVLEMLDLCTKFAEGVTFKESSPPRGPSDAISLARFLTSMGLSLETSYGVVCSCLNKKLQPGELTPQELQRIGFPCDSLEEIREARRLLLGKQMALDNEDSFAELLFWCGELELDPGSFF